MKKGAIRNDWTLAEERFLIANAGKIPMAEICLMLKRPRQAIYHKAMRLNVSLRYIDPELETCPHCGHLSATINRKGMCEPCRKRDQLADIHARIAELLPLLPLEERVKYEREEARTGSKADPLPSKPRPRRTTSDYRKKRIEEAYAIAVESVVSGNLNREVKAAQKRKERIEKKVKSMEFSQLEGTKCNYK